MGTVLSAGVVRWVLQAGPGVCFARRHLVVSGTVWTARLQGSPPTPVCVVHLTLSGYLDLTYSTSGGRAVFDRRKEAGLTEEQEMETTPAGPRESVVSQCSQLIWPGQIACLVAGLLVGRVAVAYLQWVGAKEDPWRRELVVARLVVIAAFALPWGQRPPQRGVLNRAPRRS